MTTEPPVHGDFRQRSTDVLSYLQQRHPMGLWMVTRVTGDDWIVLQSEDRSYGVQHGTVLQFCDSYCSLMVAGHGPRVIADAQSFAPYARQPINGVFNIGSYVGVPLTGVGGALFGTLCAIDPDIQGGDFESIADEVELLASLLSSVLSLELELLEEQRRASHAEELADTDALTGLGSRRRWEAAVGRARQLVDDFGEVVGVIYIDLDDLKETNDSLGHEAGDELLCRAAAALSSSVRSRDVLARVGGDEFAVMLSGHEVEMIQTVVERIRGRLESVGVSASVGFSVTRGAGSVDTIVREADERMYRDKASREEATQGSH